MSKFDYGSVIFWCIAGAALGALTATALGWPTTAIVTIAFAAGLLGFWVGLYAARGTTRFARVLAAPGVIVDLIIG